MCRDLWNTYRVRPHGKVAVNGDSREHVRVDTADLANAVNPYTKHEVEVNCVHNLVLVPRVEHSARVGGVRRALGRTVLPHLGSAVHRGLRATTFSRVELTARN